MSIRPPPFFLFLSPASRATEVENANNQRVKVFMVAFEGFYGSPASRATEVEHAKQPATPTTRLIPPSGLSLGFVPLAHSLLPPPLCQLLSALGQPMAMLALRARAWALAQIRVRIVSGQGETVP